VLCEEVLLSRINYLYQAAGSDNLAMAGGVALNAVANGRIRREGPFQNVFVQPASGDSGGCLGAAALAHVRLSKRRHSQNALTNVFLGPEFSSREVSDVLGAAGLETLDYSNDEAGLLQAVVDRLLENKTIGWFQGRMEFGPRALGGRSIIANPMNPDVKDQINRAVKRRESFRPFAPAIMHDHVERHMDITHFTPFMIETCQVTSALNLPAVTHVDGSTRPQTVTEAEAPRFYRLLSAFYERSGCPILLNTSFNQRGEPIVCSPIDALISLGSSSLDVLVIEDFIIDRENLPENWQTLLEAWGLGGRSLKTANPVIDNLYTF
jgi:carbamoyltransferase